MASITSWTRLEPAARTTNIAKGLQAQVHDPLWLLARQWQLGEFQAEDAGSPIAVRLRGKTLSVDRFYAGRMEAGVVQSQPYDPSAPLEMQVEQEALQPSHPGRSAEASLHFFRLLKVNNVGQYRQPYLDHYPLSPDEDRFRDTDSDRYQRVIQDRILNSHDLYQDLKANLPNLPDTPAIARSDQGAVTAAATTWLAWYEQRFGDSSQEREAWLPERMEYSFAVSTAAADEAVFVANEYHGGHLDWYHFNQTQTLQLELTADAAAAQPYVRTVIPSPVSYRGMPNNRWWTFEDADINLGNLEAGKEDLGRMLLLQYALSYSDDWFLMPLDLEVGSSLAIESLVVTDTFGVRTLVKPFGEVDGETGAWRMFTHATDEGTVMGDRLFLPPTLATSLNGKPIEEVHLLRDQMANLAWAVEYTVENARGQASHRHETSLINPAVLPDDIEPPADAELLYRLTNNVPPHWIPLVPSLDENQVLTLRRGRMLSTDSQSSTDRSPQGRLLAPEQPLSIEAEEIERAGAHLTRTYQHARWLQGTAHLWLGRQKRVGRGEGWSGLRYDMAEPLPGTAETGTEEPAPEPPIPVPPPPVPPTLSRISPVSGRQGQRLTLTIEGQGLLETTAVSFSGSGITTEALTIVSDLQLTVRIAIARTAAIGVRNFQLTTASGVLQSQDFDLSFRVNSAPRPYPYGSTGSAAIGGNLL